MLFLAVGVLSLPEVKFLRILKFYTVVQYLKKENKYFVFSSGGVCCLFCVLWLVGGVVGMVIFVLAACLCTPAQIRNCVLE